MTTRTVTAAAGEGSDTAKGFSNDDPRATATNTGDNEVDFRSLVMLLTLATAINNDGHPTLSKSWDGNYHHAFETPHQNRGVALDAVASILVRDFEVVAVAGRDPEPAHLRNNYESGRFNIVAVGEDTDWDNATLKELQAASMSNFTALANPDHKDAYFRNSAINIHYAVANEGESCWPEILMNSWCTLDKKHGTLPNHIATLVDYLRKYGADVEQRNSYFQKFSEHLIACCSKKMYRRITHWSSSGFISILKEISCSKVDDAFDRIGCVRPKSQMHRKDSRLGAILLSEGEYLQTIMNHSGDPPSLTKLQAAFTNADNAEWVNPYNKDTCAEFHQFLVSTLLEYLKAHNMFHNTKRQQRKLAEKLWNITYILWRLAHSQILSDHLMTLELGGCLSIPRYNIADYSKLGKTYGLNEHAKVDMGPDGPANPGQQSDTDAKPDLNESDEPEREWVQAGDNYPQIFKRWVQLQVKHFQSLSILSKLRCQPGIEDVKISLIAVRQMDKSIEPWQNTIRKLFPDTSGDATQPSTGGEHAKAVISCLNENLTRVRDNKDANSIFKAFNREDFFFTGNTHCEMALAALIRWIKAEHNVEFEDLALALENANTSVVAVSKLSCPVCWEFFNTLRNSPEEFCLRGRHSTLFPVDLPPWLPAAARQKMVDRFKRFLYDELFTMMQKAEAVSASMVANVRHGRLPSMQSNGGLSNITHSSSGATDHELRLIPIQGV